MLKKINALLAAKVSPDTIGVITPYAGQARLIRSLCETTGVEVDTVDGFQGREKEVIIISCVRSNRHGEIGFLADTRRMNVALTRAKRKLIVIGDSEALFCSGIIRSIRNCLAILMLFRPMAQSGRNDKPASGR